MIPVAQILGAALVALMLRANLPVAAVATLVSNPLTYAPIFVLAHRTGTVLLGETPDPKQEAQVEKQAHAPIDDPKTWGERFSAIGKPLALGLAVFAVTGGVITWILVYLLWGLLARLRPHGPPG